LNVYDCRAEICVSAIRLLDTWPVSVSDKDATFNTEICELFDRLIPLLKSTRHAIPSDPWSDKECRQNKRLTKTLRDASVSFMPAAVVTSGQPPAAVDVAAGAVEAPTTAAMPGTNDKASAAATAAAAVAA
jgi:hypothetical protein